MTSIISREDLTDELYRVLGRHRANDVLKLARLIDRYAYALAHKVADEQEAEYNRWRHLKPGETDERGVMRRCASCGQVRHLTKMFARDNRSPYGRKLRCNICVTPKQNGKYPETYLCRHCGDRKPVSKFPQAKRDNPKKQVYCLACTALPRPVQQVRK